MNQHRIFMNKCIELAQKGLGAVAPNPMVACVIVYEDQIIGEGYHEKYGEAHAEVNAINSVENKKLLQNSTLYVNLEPCVHFGKTPPCADLIVKHQIPKIIVGSLDPNSLMQGKGIEHLIKSGCDVKTGILERECAELNKRFFTFHKKKRPYIILKWARTADGYIDLNREENNAGKALQISNEKSRRLTHQWRSQEQAIMVGTNTAFLDNPRLTSRIENGRNPLRIVLDKSLRIPSNYHLFDLSVPTIVFTEISQENKNNLEFICIDFNNTILKQIVSHLYNREIQSVIIEGGEKLLSSFIELNLWDEARIFVSDQVLGNGIKAPHFTGNIIKEEILDNDNLTIYRNL